MWQIQLMAEWDELQGYFIRLNIWVSILDDMRIA